MSSISIDASGSRGLSSTINDQQRTFASIPTKTEDSATASFGSFGEISAVVLGSVEIEEWDVPQQEGEPERYYRIVFPGGNLQLRAENKNGSWPHASLSVRKDIGEQYPLQNAERVSKRTLDELLG